MAMKSPASAGLFCVHAGVSHSGREWVFAPRATIPSCHLHPESSALRMSLIERTLGTAVAAVADGRHVDIVGPRLSGRTSVLGHVADHFRSEGWNVLDVSGRDPQTLLPRLDEDWALIAVDDWEHLDDETRTVLLGSGSTLITTRVAGDPATTCMLTVAIPPLDGEALRVLLTRVVGFVIAPNDARSLAALTGGAVGAAIGVVNAARERGAITVTDGHGTLEGDWVVNAGPVVVTLLAPLSDDHWGALEGIAQSAVVRGLSGATFDELMRLGYIEALPDGAARVTNPLIRRWFTQA